MKTTEPLTLNVVLVLGIVFWVVEVALKFWGGLSLGKCLNDVEMGRIRVLVEKGITGPEGLAEFYGVLDAYDERVKSMELIQNGR
jgi:hypothetical protein